MEDNRLQKCMVIVAGFLITFMVYGNDIAFGVFFTPLLDTFGKSRSLTATVHSILRGVRGCSGIICGLITTKLGVTKALILGGILLVFGYATSFFADSIIVLCGTIGLCCGFASSLLFTALAASMGQIFSGKERDLAVGLQTTGINAGGIGFSILFDFLVTQYGLKGTFLITGGVVLHTFIASFIISISLPQTLPGGNNQVISESILKDETKNTQSQSECSRSHFFIWINGPVISLILGSSICFTSITSFYGLVVDVFIWNGASQEDGVTCLTIMSASGLGIRLCLTLIAFLSNDLWSLWLCPLTFCCTCAISVVGVCLIAIGNTPSVMLVGGALIGVQYGSLALCNLSFLMENVPGQYVSVAVGTLLSLSGVMALLLGPLLGAVYDWTRSYLSVLILVASLLVISFGFYVAAFVLKYRARNQTKTTKQDDRKPEQGLLTN